VSFSERRDDTGATCHLVIFFYWMIILSNYS
jgi:hypothetical protein